MPDDDNNSSGCDMSDNNGGYGVGDRVDNCVDDYNNDDDIIVLVLIT